MKQEAVVGSIQNYAHQAWLLGLGAFGKIQKEGSRFFDILLKEGKNIEARSKEEAAEAQAEVKGTYKAMVAAKVNKAAEYASRLGQVVQSRVNDALNWLNIATGKDIQTLSKHLDALEASVRELESVRKSAPAATKH